MPPIVKRDRRGRFRFYDPCPAFSIRRLPEGAEVRLLDGSFWVVDQLTGIRYRRITMADLPKCVTWNTRRGASDDEDE